MLKEMWIYGGTITVVLTATWVLTVFRDDKGARSKAQRTTVPRIDPKNRIKASFPPLKTPSRIRTNPKLNII